MSKRMCYQSFEGMFDNGIRTISSKDTFSTHSTPKFYESNFNYIIHELNNFTFKKAIIDKEKDFLKKTMDFLYSLHDKVSIHNVTSFDLCISYVPTRKELTIEELLQKRTIPMYFTINEENILLSLTEKNFKIWFKNEIITILDLIEIYKLDNINYIIQNVINDITRRPKIGANIGKKRLENEMYSCYKRVIGLYSLITTEVMYDIQKRKGLFKELNFVKRLLEILTYSMDTLSIRYVYFITELTNHYPKTSFGSGSSKRLRDIVMRPESDFADLGISVLNSLLNIF
ncbi:Hypothetical protein SRAE_2000071210 [Strongyloides ratti]|uniref:Uncharacterized protein n=1 Tax=Strongyloides ratti TaxID=34506 RepID=A0A090LES7_STRRB|nr:Hypothetical protein SRAE_2000071210 [Strongyloides ratti]CEF66040.1 Hypothetical protein SRAE_2000071210 [Strongyloides ratti]